MSAFPPGNRRDHRKFCHIERWTQVLNATGSLGHHETYELVLPNGHILRTRISHPANRPITYAKSMWNHLLSAQLQVTQGEFWNCVRKKVLPDRGWIVTPKSSIPLAAVHSLIHEFGYSQKDIAALTAKQIQDLLRREKDKQQSGE